MFRDQVSRLMASKTEETPQKEEMLEMEGPETLPDSPLLGLSDGAVRELVRSAKKRGYVTHDQINSVLPSEEVNSEQIEDVLAMFSEMGVNVVETEEPKSEVVALLSYVGYRGHTAEEC
jgi:RNA polymerase primary sigma factor